MKVITEQPNSILLVFEQKEEIVGKLTEFCRSRNMTAGWLQAIGAVEQIEIGYYELAKQSYVRTSLDGIWEILSCQGNISLKTDGDIFIHSHGVFGNREMQTRGGHIFAMTTAVTCELLLTILPDPLQRTYDQKTGLELLQSTIW